MPWPQFNKNYFKEKLGKGKTELEGQDTTNRTCNKDNSTRSLENSIEE